MPVAILLDESQRRRRHQFWVKKKIYNDSKEDGENEKTYKWKNIEMKNIEMKNNMENTKGRRMVMRRLETCLFNLGNKCIIKISHFENLNQYQQQLYMWIYYNI